MKLNRKLATTAIALTATIAGIGGTATGASALGVNAFNQQGYTYTMYGTTCTVTAGQPVVVSINGVRHLQATNTLNCNRPVNLSYTYNKLGNEQLGWVTKSTGWLTGVQSASVVQRTRCVSSALDFSYASYAEFGIDFNRDGYQDEFLVDLSNWNLRSCVI